MVDLITPVTQNVWTQPVQRIGRYVLWTISEQAATRPGTWWRDALINDDGWTMWTTPPGTVLDLPVGSLLQVQAAEKFGKSSDGWSVVYEVDKPGEMVRAARSRSSTSDLGERIKISEYAGNLENYVYFVRRPDRQVSWLCSKDARLEQYDPVAKPPFEAHYYLQLTFDDPWGVEVWHYQHDAQWWSRVSTAGVAPGGAPLNIEHLFPRIDSADKVYWVRPFSPLPPKPVNLRKKIRAVSVPRPTARI